MFFKSSTAKPSTCSGARLDHARSVSAYDANNGYQQVLGRQEVHLRWLADAIADLGGTPAESPDEERAGKACP